MYRSGKRTVFVDSCDRGCDPSGSGVIARTTRKHACAQSLSEPLVLRLLQLRYKRGSDARHPKISPHVIPQAPTSNVSEIIHRNTTTNYYYEFWSHFFYLSFFFFVVFFIAPLVYTFIAFIEGNLIYSLKSYLRAHALLFESRRYLKNEKQIFVPKFRTKNNINFY